MELSDSETCRRILGRAPGPVWTFPRKENSPSLPGIERRFLDRLARTLLSTPTTFGPYRLGYVRHVVLSFC